MMKFFLYFIILMFSHSVFALDLSRMFFAGGALDQVSNSVSNEFEITANGSQVVFTADFDNDNFFELYAINIDGSLPRRLDVSGYTGLSESIPLNFKMEDDDDFEIAPNGNYAVFEAENPSNGENRLYAVNLLDDRPTAINILPPANLAGNTQLRGRAKISNDSTKIVFIMSGSTVDENQVIIGEHRFFSLNVEQGALLSTPQASGYTQFYRHFGLFSEVFGVITQDSTRYVTMHPKLSDSALTEIFSVSLSGGSVAEVSKDSNSLASATLVDVSNDGSSVLYSRPNNSGVDASNLFVSSIDGSQTVQLTTLSQNETFTGIAVPGVPSFSPDSNAILYHVGLINDPNRSNFLLAKARKNVVRNPIKSQTGAALITEFSKENALLLDHGTFSSEADLFYLAANSNSNNASINLFNGVGVVGFIPTNQNFRNIKKHIHSNDGKVSVFVAGSELFGGIDQAYVFDSREAPGVLTRITDNQESNQFLLSSGVHLSPDNSTVILSIPDEMVNNIFSGVIKDIIATRVGTEERIRITPKLVDGGHILSLKFTPDSKILVYTADKDQDELIELYALNINEAIQALPNKSSEVCFPILTKSKSVATVCL